MTELHLRTLNNHVFQERNHVCTVCEYFDPKLLVLDWILADNDPLFWFSIGLANKLVHMCGRYPYPFTRVIALR